MKWSLIFKAMAVVGIVSEWSAVALSDNKVTVEEAADLGVKVAMALGIKDVGILIKTERLK